MGGYFLASLATSSSTNNSTNNLANTTTTTNDTTTDKSLNIGLSLLGGTDGNGNIIVDLSKEPNEDEFHIECGEENVCLLPNIVAVIELPENNTYPIDYRLTRSSKTTNTAMLPANPANTASIKTLPNPLNIDQMTSFDDIPDDTYYIRDSSNPSQYVGLADIDHPATIFQGSTDYTDGRVEVSSDHAMKLSPTTFPADTYTVNMVYTLTANEVVPAPTLSNLILNDTYYTNKTKQFVLAGTNLESTYTNKGIYLVKNGLSPNDEHNRHYATNINTYPNLPNANKGKQLAFTNPKLTEAGNYDLYVTTKGGTAKLTNALHIIPESTCRNGDPNSDCQVDIDDNMMPIKWDSNNNPQYISANELTNTAGSWYDYNQKKWANAVTLRNDCSVVSYNYSTYKQTQFGDIYVSLMESNPDRQCEMNNGRTQGTISPLELYKIYLDEVVNKTSGYNRAMYVDAGNGNIQITKDDILPFTSDAVLGYYTYIPRYAYEVQRPNAIDKYVIDEHTLLDNSKLKNEFILTFEKSTTPKSTPAPTCSTVSGTTLTAKDYRTECNIDRTYPGNDKTKANKTTWATHPAFTFGNTELNGLWVGKFETTGTRTNPTIKPNQHANISEYIGTFYDMAKGIGVPDPNNTYGGSNANISINQNSHNLSTYHSHMLKNSEWGAITYLSASTYGAGVNNVKNNGSYPTTSADADGTSSRYGVTGCGPAGKVDIPSTGTYTDGTPLTATTIESPTACSTSTDRSWTSPIGQLASTTNNIYGIYDMAGGAGEYVMGNRTVTDGMSTSGTVYLKTPVKPPYVDLYPTSAGFGTKPAWSQSTNEYFYNNDVCTWGICGGHALNETKRQQSTPGYDQSWANNYSYSVVSSNPWFLRGGNSVNDIQTGVFASGSDDGGSSTGYGSRVVLSW